MKYTWTLPSPEMGLIAARAVDHVLVEYDGPQLVLSIDASSRARYLALFADSDDQRERWIYAPVSDLEVEALCTGAVSMRNAICKPMVELVDSIAGIPTQVWRIAPESIPSGILPVRDANLPLDSGASVLSSAVRDHPEGAANVPIFRCGGRPVRDGTITFAALSAIAGSVQDLWAALEESTLTTAVPPARRSEVRTLRMAGAAHMSFGMVIAPDQSSEFSEIAQSYRALTRMSSDAAPEAWGIFPPAVLKSYVAYLHKLEQFDAEVLAQLQGTSAFVSGGYAARVRSALKPLVKSVPAAPPVTAANATGYFHAVDVDKGTYVFFDTTTGKFVRGPMGKQVQQDLKGGRREINAGNRTLYRVELDRRSGKSTLKGYDHAQLDLFRPTTKK